MPSAAKTPNYNLTQYADNGTDKVSFMGDYNADMSKVDKALNENANALSGKEDKTSHSADVTTLNTAIALKEDKTSHSADVTTLNTAIALKENITAHNGDVSTINSAIATKADASSTLSSLALKENATEHNADIQTLNTSITNKANSADVYTKSESDVRFQPKSSTIPKILLTIGDSYGDAGGNVNDMSKWPNAVLSLLKQDDSAWTLVNKSQSGGGFNVSGKKFIDQANSAISDSSFNNSNVKTIIVAGGRNDVMTHDEAYGYSSSVCSVLQNAYPDARIIVIPMLWDHTPITGYERDKAAGIASGANANAISVINGAWTWNLGNADNFPSGDIHPNAKGGTLIARYIYDYLSGSLSDRYEHYYAQVNSISLEVTAHGGFITFTWSGANVPNLSNDALFDLPEWAQHGTGANTSSGGWGIGMSNSGGAANYVNVGTQFSVAKNNMATTQTPTGGTLGGSLTLPW